MAVPNTAWKRPKQAELEGGTYEICVATLKASTMACAHRESGGIQSSGRSALNRRAKSGKPRKKMLAS
jgi:hypothetical protein